MAGARGEKLLTASDLAALCEVDLKTIHNWVDRGRINHFRTPGRHLRFRAADVAEFLKAWGYTVPRELARASAKSIMVVGTKDTMGHVTRSLGEGALLKHATHPYDALVFAGSDPADAFVVDVRAVAGDIDVSAMLEALHRSCPQATFVALADEPMGLPSFVTKMGRNDAQALRALLAPEGAQAPAAQQAQQGFEEPARGLAAGGGGRG
jgi:excisionase family DNA binding protein